VDLGKGSENEVLRRTGRLLASNWSFPMDFMFLTPAGEYIGKLNPLDDFNPSNRSNEEVLFAYMDKISTGP
jgi:hypothetical protein